MRKFLGVFIFTIVFGILTLTIIKFSKNNLLIGITIMTTGIFAGLGWMEALVRTPKNGDLEEFRRMGLSAFVTGVLLGAVNYGILSMTDLVSNNFLIGLAFILPLITVIYQTRLIYYVWSDKGKLRFFQIFLLGFFANLYIMGVIIGLTFSIK